ncbi:MAG TPA: IclR family transcriptional regulator C-terminal domain-containing protein [Burkholderiales bacterium]
MARRAGTGATARATRGNAGRQAALPKEKAAGAVQSLTRGLQLLQRLGEAEGGVMLTDLAQTVGLPNSTTHRLLTTLEAMGFARQTPDLGLWQVGVEAFRVGNAFLRSRDIVEQARPHLYHLMEEAGETANLALLHEGRAVMVYQVECHEMMRMIVRIGGAVPMHASGVGKAMLAAMSEVEVKAVLHRHGLARHTPHTVDSPARLAEEMAATRGRGFSIDDEEHAVGLRCAAAAILDEEGRPLGAISISGPAARLSRERLLELGARVAREAASITRELGGLVPKGQA